MTDSKEKSIQKRVNAFLKTHGESELSRALDEYENLHTSYIIKGNGYVKKIPLYSIKYISVCVHDLTIHTIYGDYTKYGILKKEYNRLKNYGFCRCSQNILVSLYHIDCIKGNQVILKSGEKLHISRSCAPKLISIFMAFESE